MLEKRLTIMSVDGVLAQFTDTNPFETDLETSLVRYPDWAYLTFCARIGMGEWKEVVTIYRHTN